MPTLSDQLSVPDSPDLRDLLKAHNSRRRRRGEAVTLASALASDERDISSDERDIASASASAAAVGRTLLDILRDEESSSDSLRWRDLLRIRRSGPRAAADAGSIAVEAIESDDAGGSGEERPVRLSLMALLQQAEWQGSAADGEIPPAAEEGEGAMNACWCCVCMVRQKGAAFIPCGHTFCRACSRELWVRRGSCPLCNADVLDILNIY